MKNNFKKAGCHLGSAALMMLLVSSAELCAQTNASNLLSAGAPTPRKFFIFDHREVEAVVVESAETTERNEIRSKASALLAAKEYDKLDEFAQRLRESKECWANGALKLSEFYAALEPSKKATVDGFETRLTDLRSWVAERPRSITARVALASTMIAYAWSARGSGWANTVTDDSWRTFDLRLKVALSILNDAKQLEAKCPYYWSVRLLAAMAMSTGRPEYDALFEEAVHSTPGYAGYYNRRAIYLLPRWLGAPGELEKDLEDSADKIGGPAGDKLYAQVVWCAHLYVGSKNFFEEYNFSWPRINRGFQEIEKLYPASLAAKSEHAMLAVIARDQRQAHKCFVALNGLVDLTVWDTTKRFIDFAAWSSEGKQVTASGQTIVISMSEPAIPRAVASDAHSSGAPSAGRPPAVTSPNLYPELALKGVSGVPGRRIAQINNCTLMAGETGKVRVRDTKVVVVCKEIREDSVLITVDGKPMELKLGAKSVPADTAQK